MKRGEIWQVSFDPTIGAEIRKSRPAVIISTDAVGTLALRVVVPLTGWQTDFAHAPWMIRIDPSSGNGQTKASAADAFQVKSLSLRRLTRRLGAVTPSELDTIVRAVGRVIGHP
jgi:mRNA interferase MazF